MQRLTLFMIVVVTLFDFLGSGDRFGNGGFLPSSVSYFAELVGGAAMAYVIIAGTRTRFQFVRPAYWLAFGALLFSIICGLIVNHVDSGPILAGMRAYLRAVPWFFVPAVFAYSDDQLRTQFKLLLGICALQLPLAVLQRIQTMDRSWGFVAVTGDWTTGTLGDPGTLCIFLVGAICVIAALFERKKLGVFKFLLMFFVLLVPTMINETKAMVAFLPLGLLLTFLYASPPEIRIRKVMGGVVLLIAFGAVFVPVYDALNADRQYGQSLGDFFLKGDNVDAYVSTGGAAVGTTKEIGRGDSIAVPVAELAKDPVQLLFGLGIGNASDSSLGLQYGGFYADKWRIFLQTQFSRFILELGAIGVGLVLLIYLLIFQDCKAVARGDDTQMGALAAAWTGVIGLIALTMFYSKIEVFPSLSFLFWYFSGIIAARRMRMVAARDVAPAAGPVRNPMALAHGPHGAR